MCSTSYALASGDNHGNQLRKLVHAHPWAEEAEHGHRRVRRRHPAEVDRSPQTTDDTGDTAASGDDASTGNDTATGDFAADHPRWRRFVR
jgi:hypothetical protein